MHRTVALGSAKPLRIPARRPFLAALLILALLAGALLSTSQPARAAAPPAGWTPPPYAEDLTDPCLPRLPRTVVRHDLLALALERCQLPPATLHYHRFDPSGGVPGAGQYTFLLPGGVVTTYEQWRTDATRLRLHTHDRTGRSQAAFYDLVEPGDLFEWWTSDRCWARYRVTAVPPPATEATHREFGVTGFPGTYYALSPEDCRGAVDPNTVLRLRWTPAAGAAISGAEWLSERDRRIVGEAAVEIHRYFDRWLGITPPLFEVQVERFPFPCLSGGGGFHLILYLPCSELKPLVRSTLAEQYADAAVLTHFYGRSPEPAWLVTGHAHYVYARWVAADGRAPYEKFRRVMIGFARATDLALDSALLNDPYVYSNRGPSEQWHASRRQFQRWIGALAIDWLVAQTSEAALEQYAQTRFAGDWRAAFHDAFGMSSDEFRHAFAAYRAALAAADGGAPRLSRPLHHVVFFGPLTDERRALIPAIEEIVDFFEHQYGLVASAATFVLDIDQGSYDRLTGAIGTTGDCGRTYGSFVYVLDVCTAPIVVAHEFVHILQHELRSGHGGLRPRWLLEGAADYLATLQAFAAGRGNPETAWGVREASAAGVIQKLSQGPTALPTTASYAEVARAAIEKDEQYHVYTLAVRHLVERFGIARLFAAFGPAWSAAGPDEAGRFRAVFGASLDDFHASFGRWLQALPPAPPSSSYPWSLPAPRCVDAEIGTRGVHLVDLTEFPAAKANWEWDCLIVHGGGRVRVSHGDVVRTFTLYGGWQWRVFDAHPLGASSGDAAVHFVAPNYSNKGNGFIRFALSDGRELARDVPADAPDEMHVIFDQITSVPAEPGE